MSRRRLTTPQRSDLLFIGTQFCDFSVQFWQVRPFSWEHKSTSRRLTGRHFWRCSMGAGKRIRIVALCAGAVVATIGTAAFAGNGVVTNSSFEFPVTGGYIDDSNAEISNPSNANFWGWGYFFANTAVDHDAGVQVNINATVTNAADNSPQDGW